jgi:diguanylate cyclase (GGDEF)-like protein
MFSQSGFLPHGYCLSWSPGLLWTMVISDVAIALAYYSIPMALLMFLRRRRNIQFHWMFLLFGIFIFACGTTHIIAVLNIWQPAYWLDAVAKLITALVSVATAIFLWPLVPVADRYIAQRESDMRELELVNKKLARTLELLNVRSTELDRLNRMSDLLQKADSLEEFGTAVSSTAQDLDLGAAGAVFLARQQSSLADVVSYWGDLELSGHVLPMEECRALCEVDPGASEPEHAEKCSLFRFDGQEHLCVPLQANDEILGVIQFRGLVDAADTHVRALIETLCERASLALANIRLRENLLAKSIRDPLTGLFNRRFLDEALPLEEARALRANSALCIVMFDLDRFKALNDAYGHEAGDAALKVFARLLQGSVRNTDIACRYGGEEFLLLLPGTSIAEAARRAEAIRTALEKSRVEHRGRTLERLTVSIGIAELPTHGPDGHAVVRAADKMLYQAKQNGRNRIELMREAS